MGICGTCGISAPTGNQGNTKYAPYKEEGKKWFEQLKTNKVLGICDSKTLPNSISKEAKSRYKIFPPPGQK